MINRKISKTTESFQPFYQDALSAIDGIEIQNNLNEFVMLLDRWSERKIRGLN